MNRNRKHARVSRNATLYAIVLLVGVAAVWPVYLLSDESGESVGQQSKHSGHSDITRPRDMRSSQETSPLSLQIRHTETDRAQLYMCAMHTHIRRAEPGQCPICGMDLVPVPEDADQDEEDEAVLRVSEAQKALMRVATAPVERKFPIAELRLIGKVAYDETRLEYITAWVPGRIDELYVDFTGIEVTRGTHMVRLYSPELYSAQEELLQAQRSLTELSKSSLASLKRSARGTVDSAREKLRLWGLSEEQINEVEKSGKPKTHVTIFAPASGIVIDRNAQEGMYVDIGTRIFTVADLSQVWVQLEAYESDLAWLRYGQTVRFTTEAYAGEVFEGRIAFIDPVLDPKTRTVRVRLTVDNADARLKPDMFVRAQVQVLVGDEGRAVDDYLVGKWISPMHPEIVRDKPGRCPICGMTLIPAESIVGGPVGDGQEAPLVIPASAPLLTGTRAIVYVETPGARMPTYSAREVKLGPRAGSYYTVMGGLQEGEHVVVEGNFKIDSALQIKAQPSMMNPEGGASNAGHQH